MINEPVRAGEFLLAEANGTISRKRITIASGRTLAAGTVLGKVTASGKYVAYANGAADGTEVAAGILYAAVDASAADAAGVMICRHAEVVQAALTGIDSPGITDLDALQIICR